METYLLLFSLIFAEELKWNTTEIKKEKKVQGRKKWIHQKESEIKKGVRRKKSAPEKDINKLERKGKEENL